MTAEEVLYVRALLSLLPYRWERLGNIRVHSKEMVARVIIPNPSSSHHEEHMPMTPAVIDALCATVQSQIDLIMSELARFGVDAPTDTGTIRHVLVHGCDEDSMRMINAKINELEYGTKS